MSDAMRNDDDEARDRAVAFVDRLDVGQLLTLAELAELDAAAFEWLDYALDRRLWNLQLEFGRFRVVEVEAHEGHATWTEEPQHE